MFGNSLARSSTYDLSEFFVKLDADIDCINITRSVPVVPCRKLRLYEGLNEKNQFIGYNTTN